MPVIQAGLEYIQKITAFGLGVKLFFQKKFWIREGIINYHHVMLPLKAAVMLYLRALHIAEA
jgi:hypothetical protein